MRLFLLAGIFFIGTAHIVYAKDLGSVGQTYSILEDDFLQLIEARYQFMKESGEWDRQRQAWQKQVVQAADRPRAVTGITTAVVNKTYHINPSVTLSRDIKSIDGKIIAYAGTTINPLSIMPLHKALLFISADDPKQLAWAARKAKFLSGKSKIILVNGSIKHAISVLQQAVYFDQWGRLSKRFKIKHVPAMLQQDGVLLKIEEIAI